MIPALVSILLGLANPSAEVHLDGRSFRIPEGFAIERVAGPPLVDRPIVADFDDEGRLYVADSSGSNDPVQKQLKDRPHRIIRLEDVDGDGTFDRSIIFADGMMFPAGAMFLDGSLYVAAPPSIWKLTDTDGDGVADRREEWFRGKTLTGCANDLHGPYAGPDGMIYWTKGAFAEQVYERPGREPFRTRAAHVFRARPDGSHLEAVMTGGMDNPVEVAFAADGERFVTSTFVQHPGGGRRDGILHAIYGGVYGKDHDAIDGHPRTGPDLMPVMTHLGAAAPSGLMRYESSAFGPDYQGNLFAALFNMHKVTRHVLMRDGSTFQTRDEDFVTSADQDFHPTDVLEDADGSLLLVDTGGWYKLCCPTSQIGKPDVLGAIYRVRKLGPPGIQDPRGRKLPLGTMSPPQLAELLDDPRPVVRRRAVAELARRGEAAIPALRDARDRSEEGQLQRIWAATRIDSPSARAFVRRELQISGAVAAIHSIALWRDREAREVLEEIVQGWNSPRARQAREFGDRFSIGSPSVRRAAAEALGRIGDRASVAPIFDGFPGADPMIEHSLIHALIEIADRDETSIGLHRSAHRGPPCGDDRARPDAGRTPCRPIMWRETSRRKTPACAPPRCGSPGGIPSGANLSRTACEIGSAGPTCRPTIAKTWRGNSRAWRVVRSRSPDCSPRRRLARFRGRSPCERWRFRA